MAEHGLPRQPKNICDCRQVEQGEVCIPRFDKSALNGKGDQLPRNRWDRVQTPCDVVVVEGWMVGFSACDGQDVAKIHPGLRLVNEKLKKYQEGKNRKIMNGWVMLGSTFPHSEAEASFTMFQCILPLIFSWMNKTMATDRPL